jgi:hypothetical protein
MSYAKTSVQPAQPTGPYSAGSADTDREMQSLVSPQPKVFFWSPEFDSRVKRIRRCSDFTIIGFNVVILSLLAVYLTFLAIQASANYEYPDVRVVTETKSSMAFPVILFCPVLGSTSTTLSNATCTLDGTVKSCKTRTKSLGFMTCLEYNYDMAAAASSVSDTLELSVNINLSAGSDTYPAAEVFMYTTDASVNSGSDIQKLLSTNFVIERQRVGIVHLRKNEYVNLQSKVTKTTFPFSFSATNIANPTSSSRSRLRITYEDITVTSYQETVTKDFLYVLGALGGAYSLLAVSTACVHVVREKRIKNLIHKLEKEAKATGAVLDPKMAAQAVSGKQEAV